MEWMETSGVFHGMSHVAVRSVQGRRQMCVIDSDVESAHAMKAAGLDALYVFIEAPPEEAMRGAPPPLPAAIRHTRPRP